jgi:hypothetical protein
MVYLAKCLIECKNVCWCGFCAKPINKKDYYLCIHKTARKGVTRTNICGDCLIGFYVELKMRLKGKMNVNKRAKEILNEFILGNLEKSK